MGTSSLFGLPLFAEQADTVFLPLVNPADFIDGFAFFPQGFKQFFFVFAVGYARNTDSAVEGAHHLFDAPTAAQALEPFHLCRQFPCVQIQFGTKVIGQSARDVVEQSATGDVRECFYRTSFFHRVNERFDIDACRPQQHLSDAGGFVGREGGIVCDFMLGTRKNLILEHDPSHNLTIIPKIISRPCIFWGFLRVPSVGFP